MSSPAFVDSSDDTLFVEEGRPIKFFIQNDLEPELKEDLIRLIQVTHKFRCWMSRLTVSIG